MIEHLEKTLHQVNPDTLEVENEQLFTADKIQNQQTQNSPETEQISTFKQSSLLSSNIDELLRRIEEKEIMLLEEKTKLNDSRKVSYDYNEDDMEVEIDEINTEVRKKTNPLLWTEKYKSYKFFDLLTEESTNRNVLTWLKSWDEVVFPDKPV